MILVGVSVLQRSFRWRRYSFLAVLCSTSLAAQSLPMPSHNNNIGIQSRSSLVGVFVGSGSDGMSDPRIAQVIVDLARRRRRRRPPSSVQDSLTVLYLGTATYDLPYFAQRQTRCFADQGCHVTSLHLVHETPSPEQIQDTIGKADIVVVGGGNTLYAVDRWKAVPSVVPSLQAAMERGVILTGGSAGAICWFDGGHSDSMDPDTYYRPMMQKFGSSADVTTTGSTAIDESSAAPANDDKVQKDWKYIRIPGLGFLPGLLCPHHDKIQSNGVLRAHDFDQMLLQHPGEVGIGIDHWAALVVTGNGDSYRVVSLEGKPGSVLYTTSTEDDEGTTPASFSADAKGVPGIWIKRVEHGKVVSTLLPPEGKLSDVLCEASEIVQDFKALEQCRMANADIMAA